MCGIWILLSQNKIKDVIVYFEHFMKIQKRGPEYSSFNVINDKTLIGFHRLAIINNTYSGNQPYLKNNVYLVCNGEIYNYKKLIIEHDLTVEHDSDCEVILHLYIKYGLEKTLQLIDGEYAFVIVDGDKSFAARDPVGVRPLFYSVENNKLCFSSEIKGLQGDVFVFPPGMFLESDKYQNILFSEYYKYNFNNFILRDLGEIYNTLTKCVQKRLMFDRPFGCLLSGGLDSSLICGITKKLLGQSFPAFTICFEGSTDLPYAKEVAKYLDLQHYIVKITPEEALDKINKTIYVTESYDITTIRASVMQLILGEWIRKNTNIKVLLVGENSDEVHGSYLYLKNAPSNEDIKSEAIRLVHDVHMFDGLRTDRTMAGSGLEVRLPFADKEYIDLYLNLDSKYFAHENGVEKYYLRKAFEGKDIIPDNVLWRKKDAFSDSVSSKERSWYQIIQDHINNIVSDEEFENYKDIFRHNEPMTKESYYYRKKFCEYFGDDKSNVIPYFWMPKYTKTNDPSARTL